MMEGSESYSCSGLVYLTNGSGWPQKLMDPTNPDLERCCQELATLEWVVG
jgi:hypothetical protein